MINTLEILTLKFKDSFYEIEEFIRIHEIINLLLLNGITKQTISFLNFIS